MKQHLLALVAAALLGFSAVAEAAPPKPLPNPDRPAITPVSRGADAGGSGSATASTADICPALRSLARRGNRASSLRVFNLKTRKNVCALNPGVKRSLASNTKLFTTATALEVFGPERGFRTRVFAAGNITDGVLKGNLYLRGGGDPSFGTQSFLDTYLGGEGTPIETLAAQIARRGVKRVTGRVFADDTIFDRLRGVADSGYATSPWIGPLSGLSFNAGFTSASLSSFSSDPARLAARTLARALRARGVGVRLAVGNRPTPKKWRKSPLATRTSPDMAWMARVTNLNSVNFWAEILLKDLGAYIRREGSTAAGVKVVRREMTDLGVRVWPIDGSGLTISNRSTAHEVVKLLFRARYEPWGRDFTNSLPTAAVDGTLADRMRGSAAQGRCRAKTGTLTGVTALSGYCFNASGRRFAFSILMNDVFNLDRARAAQDRIAALIAGL